MKNKKVQKRIQWILKRIILNVLMLAITFFLLLIGSILVTKYMPDFVILLYILVLVYGMYYRVICEVLFDGIIGDGSQL